MAVPGAAGRGEGKVRAALTVSGPRRWEEGVHGPVVGSRGLGRACGRAGLGPRAAESRIGEVLCGHFKNCVTINILCCELVTRLLVTNQRLSACQAPFAIIHMISKFSIICT